MARVGLVLRLKSVTNTLATRALERIDRVVSVSDKSREVVAQPGSRHPNERGEGCHHTFDVVRIAAGPCAAKPLLRLKPAVATEGGHEFLLEGANRGAANEQCASDTRAGPKGRGLARAEE